MFLVAEVSVEEGVSLIKEKAVDQKEKPVEVVVEDLEMKQMPSETKDDWYTLSPIKESSLVSQGILYFPTYSVLFNLFFSFYLTELFLSVYSFYDRACSSLSKRN